MGCNVHQLVLPINLCTLFSQAERERKRQEQLDKKQEAKLLLAEEEAKLGGKSPKAGGGGGATKVTRAQIAEAEEQRRRESEASGATALPKRLSIDEPTLELNPNREAQQRRMAGELEARTVDEAIAVLSVGQEPQDKHPERRMKAAYAAYEERELPRLKEENPNLRMSQLKQLLRKEWMKSPENPMNQHHVAYNAKTQYSHVCMGSYLTYCMVMIANVNQCACVIAITPGHDLH